MSEFALGTIKNRTQMIRFFDGYSEERVEELDERKLKRPLVKTHLLEVLNGQCSSLSEALPSIFKRCGIEIKALDDELFLVSDLNIGEIGFLEQLTSRIIALYSTNKSDVLYPWVRNLVFRNSDLDHVWLSGLTFGVLWELVVKLSRPHRFTRLVFTHQSIFDIDNITIEDVDEDEEPIQQLDDDNLGEIVERRATRFSLVDRVGVIQSKLNGLQQIYSPLYAISQLRFPSPIGRGGHDFYDNGRVTNRSESFRDHRSHILFVVRIYQQLLNETENKTWYSITESIGIPGQFHRIVGAPVVINFEQPLEKGVFDRWISATFERKRNRFRLWGHPIRLGPTKVHVYGVDRHLWLPIFLELTAKGCTAIIPKQTCGNTVHRLVTNIQRYLDPGAQAFIGNKSYSEIVKDSAQGVKYELDRE
jgi:hypothetical protein